MGNPYVRTYKGVRLDYYRLADVYGITHPCHGHVFKKMLAPGGRSGGKSLMRDIQDCIDTLERWKEMIAEDEEA